jgi:hypothetical protein
MAYNQWPSQSQIIPKLTANEITLTFSGTQQTTPMNIDKFLKELGWTQNNVDPDNNDELYQKQNDQEISLMHFRWYEAVAYEWYRTMTLGGM